MTEDTPPPPTPNDEEILALLRAAALRGLTQTRNAENDLLRYGYDLKDVCELIADCMAHELSAHQVSDHYPAFYDYIVILQIELIGEHMPFYVKVALQLPDMETGELMSFHEWGRIR